MHAFKKKVRPTRLNPSFHPKNGFNSRNRIGFGHPNLHNNFQFDLQMNTQKTTTGKGVISLDFDLAGQTASFKNRNEQRFDVLWDICEHIDHFGAFRDISYITSTHFNIIKHKK